MTGDLDLLTTTSQNFHYSGNSDKPEKVKRDNLKIGGDISLKTTHHDFVNFSDKMSPSNLRAAPQWFTEPKINPIIIS